MLQNQDKNNDLYFTSDFGCCVALVSRGFKVTDLNREVKKVKFGFERSQELLDAVDSYRRFELQVDARVYFEASKMVKGLIYGDEL